MIEHLVDFFANGIERKRHYVPKIVQRVRDKRAKRGEKPREVKPRGLTKEQEILFLNQLQTKVIEQLNITNKVTLYVDYDAQGLLKEIEKLSSIENIVRSAMLPPKLNIEISHLYICITDGETTLLEKSA